MQGAERSNGQDGPGQETYFRSLLKRMYASLAKRA
jgi:hypothetical protein